jgi:hypothetical protein
MGVRPAAGPAHEDTITLTRLTWWAKGSQSHGRDTR